MWTIAKHTGRPLHPDLGDAWDWPHTITNVVALRQRYDSYQEMSEPPPEEWWDFPHLIRQHIDKLYPSHKKTTTDVEVTEVEG